MQRYEQTDDRQGSGVLLANRDASSPRASSAASAGFHSSESGEGPRHGTTRRALVVDDDRSLHDTLGEALHLLGYETVFCASGRDALGRLRRGERPDVILLDLVMPAMSGWEFRVEQRKDPELAKIPVIVLSADRTPMAAAIDADGFLEKPVGIDALASTVERVLLQRENRLLQARLVEADRLRSLGTLAAGVAHEINSPLCFVGLNAAFVSDKLRALLGQVGEGEAAEGNERARDPSLQSEVAEALERIQLGVERIGAIVRGLKTFSHPDDTPMTRVDVTKVLDSTIAILKHEIDAHAKLTREYQEVPPVEANEARLSQVLLNLLLNAAQSFDEGATGKEVRVRIRNCPPTVVVEVEDNGSGIAEHVRERVFEPFFTTKPAGVGTGLGLSICHGIVRSFRGALTFETQVGKGTVFRMALPALPSRTA